MPKGGRPKPTALRLLEGNPGKRVIPQNEPQPEPGMPAMPADLGPLAQAEWELLGPVLYRMGVLSSVDGSAFAAYCRMAERYLLAEQKVRAQGMTVASPNGYEIPHPAISISNNAYDRMLKMLLEFGLTPASRSRITAHGAKADDPLETFLANKKGLQRKERP